MTSITSVGFLDKLTCLYDHLTLRNEIEGKLEHQPKLQLPGRTRKKTESVSTSYYILPKWLTLLKYKEFKNVTRSTDSIYMSYI